MRHSPLSPCSLRVFARSAAQERTVRTVRSWLFSAPTWRRSSEYHLTHVPRVQWLLLFWRPSVTPQKRKKRSHPLLGREARSPALCNGGRRRVTGSHRSPALDSGLAVEPLREPHSSARRRWSGFRPASLIRALARAGPVTGPRASFAGSSFARSLAPGRWPAHEPHSSARPRRARSEATSIQMKREKQDRGGTGE